MKSRGYIHIYFGLFDNNVSFGSSETQWAIGEALLRFLDFDFHSIRNKSDYSMEDFESAHPYFSVCSNSWKSVFLTCLNDHTSDESIETIDDLVDIQSRYAALLDGLYRQNGRVHTEQLKMLMAQNRWIRTADCFSRMTILDDGRIDYFVASFEECLLLELIEILRRKISFKPCKNCGRLFIPKRSNTDYCTRISNIDGKTCSEVGYTHTFSNNVKNDDLLLAYTRAYKAHYARMTKPRKKSANMTREAFESWYQEAKKKLSQARSGELDAATFKAWLKE
jgi:hypothetical protein